MPQLMSLLLHPTMLLPEAIPLSRFSFTAATGFINPPRGILETNTRVMSVESCDSVDTFWTYVDISFRIYALFGASGCSGSGAV
jgi:hypothetical protein